MMETGDLLYLPAYKVPHALIIHNICTLILLCSTPCYSALHIRTLRDWNLHPCYMLCTQENDLLSMLINMIRFILSNVTVVVSKQQPLSVTRCHTLAT